MSSVGSTHARLAWTVCAMALCASMSPDAQAQAIDDGTSTWRRQSPHRLESPQSWALEMRFGPYKPNIDDDFGATGPYEQVFGDSTRWYLGFELDYQALRIPHVGTLGPGFSWGYTRSKANARRADNGMESAEETSLWIMPMYVAGVFRVDVFANEFGVPLVPYVKLGLGYALWKATDGSGTSDYSTNGETVEGKGRSYGWHFAPGMMVQLDPFDRHAARQLDNSVGVNHSYAYVEWMRSQLDGFGAGDQLRVGTSTWVAGLAFEF